MMAQWLTVKGLQDPSSIEFLRNPEYRTIAAFFLGWVFLYSLQLIACSKPVHDLLSFNLPFSRNTTRDIESRTSPHMSSGNPPAEKTPMLETSFSSHQRLRTNENQALVLILALCFASASVAQFASLLTFSNNHGAIGCAFVVAWGGMAGQAARLVGLLILGRELRRLGLGKYEAFGFYAMLVVALGLIFANSAIGVGVLRFVPPMGKSLCYRRHYMPMGIASSALLIVLDLFVITRTVIFITPPFLKWKHQAKAIEDFRMRRALSLFVLEALTITSTVTNTNILTDFIPFSIGAVIVLAVFHTPYTVKDDAISVHLSDAPDTQVSSRIPSVSAGSTISIRRMSASLDDPSHSVSVSRQNSSSRDFRSTATSSTAEAFARYMNRHLGTPQPSPIASQSPNMALPSTPTLPIGAPPWHQTPILPPTANSSIPSSLSGGRKILPEQVKYAERFEHENSLPAPVWRTHRPQVSLVISEDGSRDSATDSIGPLTSAVLGSDIIRINSADPQQPRIATREDNAHKRSDSGSTNGTRASAFSPTSRDSTLLSPPSAGSPRHFSFGMAPSQYSRETLEVVYEGEAAQIMPSRSRASSRRVAPLERRGTFGPRPFSTFKKAAPPLPEHGMDIADMLPLSSPPGLPSPRTRYPSTPSGPRPLPGILEPMRSPPLSSDSTSNAGPPPPYMRQ